MRAPHRMAGAPEDHRDHEVLLISEIPLADARGGYAVAELPHAAHPVGKPRSILRHRRGHRLGHARASRHVERAIFGAAELSKPALMQWCCGLLPVPTHDGHHHAPRALYISRAGISSSSSVRTRRSCSRAATRRRRTRHCGTSRSWAWCAASPVPPPALTPHPSTNTHAHPSSNTPLAHPAPPPLTTLHHPPPVTAPSACSLSSPSRGP